MDKRKIFAAFALAVALLLVPAVPAFAASGDAGGDPAEPEAAGGIIIDPDGAKATDDGGGVDQPEAAGGIIIDPNG